jgi:hypothetical protein
MLKENTYTQKYFYEVNIFYCKSSQYIWSTYNNQHNNNNNVVLAMTMPYSGQGLGERTGSKKTQKYFLRG